MHCLKQQNANIESNVQLRWRHLVVARAFIYLYRIAWTNYALNDNTLFIFYT